MLSDPKVLKLFELLTKDGTSAVEPVFAPRRDSWVSYPVVEKVMGADSEYAERLLSDLQRLGYLVRQFQDKISLCPVDNSQDLRLVATCPKCHSPHVVRRRMLEHAACGHIGPEEEFGTGEQPTCPKCQAELVLLGSDYTSPGIQFKCEECGEVFDKPVEKWQCRTCSRVFEKNDLRELVMYRYMVNRTQLSKLKVERIPKARVREFLEREGYKVQESVQTVGRSGAEHEIDFLATKRSGPLEHRIVVGFASAEKEVESEEVIKLYAKAYDVDAQDTIMVASPKLSEDALSFAKHYQIKVFEADKLVDAEIDIQI